MSDSHILSSWHRNAAPWAAAVRGQQIESRRLVTDRAIVDTVLDAVPAPDGRTVLDIGCGEGWLARSLAARGFQVVGVDAVPALIDAARRADAGGDYRVVTYEAIADGALSLTVDVAIANFSLIGKDAVDALIRRVPALLAPTGTFIVQTLHPATARGEHPYVDGWREGSWAGFSDDFGDPPPWYFRTMGGWIRQFVASGLQVRDVIEPIHPHTGSPASVVFVTAMS